MRGAGNRGIGALVAAAAVAASCGWPEFAFEAASDPTAQGGEDSAGADTGGASGATGGRGGSAQGGSTGGSSTPSSCENHALDPPETDIDCGGGCPKCEPGKTCILGADCAQGRSCTSHGVCEILSCSNGMADGLESDQDCGGSDCDARCMAGQECRDASDCESAICESGRCVSGTCDPESGACGTSDCHCANGRQCMTHADCASGNCAGGSCAEGAKVFARNDSPDATGPSLAILETFLVQNDAPSDLPLGELAVRYYFSSDAVIDQRAHCDDTRAVDANVCPGISTPLFAIQSTFADSYVEVRFPDGATLRAGAQTSEIPVAIESKDGSLYDQRGDYSFSAASNLAVNSKVTLYRRGVLIWGDPPP